MAASIHWISSEVRLLMKVLLSIAAVLAGATTLAATVHADPNDAQFVQNIRNGMGVEVNDAPALISLAHQLCDEFKAGTPYGKILSEFRQNNQYWDKDQATFFISASAQAYCPEFVDQ
jgi:hypothetical protein